MPRKNPRQPEYGLRVRAQRLRELDVDTAVEPPTYDVDDDVFFRCPDGPSAGRVIARGKDGCTVECAAGKRHKVAWRDVHGLKSRRSFEARVVDRGSAGAIMEREDGTRFFMAGEVPDDASDYFRFDDEDDLQKSDAFARLCELAALLKSPAPLPLPVPGAMPILWSLRVR